MDCLLPLFLYPFLSQVTTRCVVSELVALGPQLSGAVFIAKRFQLRVCGHRKSKPATDCIMSLIGGCHGYPVGPCLLAVVHIGRGGQSTQVLCSIAGHGSSEAFTRSPRYVAWSESCVHLAMCVV